MNRSRFAVLAVALLSAFPTFGAITGIVMSTDGQPIPGARVTAYALETTEARRARLTSSATDRQPLASADTNARGGFSLETPKDIAVVELTVDRSGYAPDRIRVERDEQTGAIALVTAPMVTGTVTAAGKPVANATVVWSSGAGESVAKSDAQGHYSVPDPSKWAQRVVVIHPDYAIENEGAGPAGRLPVDRKLTTGAPVSGRITRQPGDAAVAGATVLVDGWPAGKTGDDGSFTIAHAPKEWTAVDARIADQAATRTHAAGALAMRVENAAVVSGTLRDARQQPIAGAEIRIGLRPRFGAGDSLFSAITDAKGNYSIVGVRPGVYEIGGVRPGFTITPSSLSVTSAARVNRTMTATADALVLGTILDEDKKPVAAAVVALQSLSRGGGGGLGGMLMRAMQPQGRRAWSAPDGTFVVHTNNDGEVEVTADKKGWPPAKSSAFRVASGEKKAGVVVTIPRGVAITGRVTDRNGKPLSGVSVISGESQNGGPGAFGGRAQIRAVFGGPRNGNTDTIATGTDGTFTMRLKEGAYDLNFRREGFAAKTLRAQQVSATTKPIDVTLEPGVQITGRVVRGGAGVEGVNVNAVNSDPPASTVTDFDGRFTLSDLTPGSLMVVFRKPDGSVEEMRSVNAPANDITIQVPAGSRVSGRVIDKTTHQPITTFEAGISRSRSGGGMTFMIQPAMHSFTSDDGTFSIDNVQPGPSQLVVSAPGYTTAELPNIQIEEGKPVTDLEVSLDTGARLVGRVTSPDGAPLSGVAVRQVTEDRMIGGGMNNLTVSDANGEYTIDGLESGEHAFSFTRNGYLNQEKTANLTGRETRLDVQLSTGQRVTGTVTNDSGVPIADADVRAMSAAMGGFGQGARTDGSGAFAFDGLAPGHYTFSASKAGLAEAVIRDFDISAGAPVQLVMKSGATIFGHVTGLAPADLQNATVRAMTGSGAASAPVDSTGSYRIDGVQAGSARVSAMVGRGFMDGRTSDVKTVDVEAGGSVQVDIDFPSQTVIQGRVTRNGTPLPGATVMFNPRGGSVQTSSRATTDDNGSYSATGLSDAPYSVTVIDLQRLSPYTTSYEVHGSGTFNIDMRVVSVRGRVSSSDTDEPIANAQVQLRSSGGAVASSGASGGTDAAGNFVIDGVTPGTYSAVVQKDGYGGASRDNIVVTDTGADDLVFKLMRNDGVVIRVVDARDQRLLDANVIVLDANNQPIQDSLFRMDRTPAGVRLSLAPGQYRAIVSAFGYASQSVTIMSPSQPTVALTPGGTLVIQQKGSAHAVRLLDANRLSYGRGFYPLAGSATPLQNIAPGAYTVEVLGTNGAIVNSVNATVAEGQTSSVTID